MSYVISRRKDGLFQQYCSPDIYGRGKWRTSGEGNWWELPMEFKYECWAINRMTDEKERDPDWEYSVDFYDR